MEFIGSFFLILALAVVVALFIARPFIQGTAKDSTGVVLSVEQQREHVRSSLLAEHDRVLTALQELDFDFALGKVPAEGYPMQREALMRTGAEVLRKLDSLAPSQTQGAVPGRAEDRIEAAVAARRADARRVRQEKERPISEPAHGATAEDAAAGNGNINKRADELEDIIAMRKREREESSGGFCPHCGKTVSKSDKFCSRCGATL